MSDGALLPTAPPATTTKAPSPIATDVVRSTRNAVTLGLSLLGTWAVALGVRIFLPRQLGPAQFGAFQFADSFTTTVFVLISLGLETYVGKEVAVRRDHANDFFGGTLLVRLALGAVVMVVAVLALIASGKPERIIHLVIILGVAQILVNLNATSAALLHAAGIVGALSVLNVLAKLAWGVGIVIALVAHWGILGVAWAMLLAESFRSAGLIVLAKRHVGLRLTLNLPATWAVLRASLPFYVGILTQVIYLKLDLTVMSFLTTDVEVGWYATATTLAAMSFLLSPLIGWVLAPMLSRAAVRSEDELFMVARRAMEVVLSIAFPMSLMLGLSAHILIVGLFGTAYAPAAPGLALLAPTFLLTYIGMVAGTLMNRLERGWQNTAVGVGSMVLSLLLNLWLVPRALAMYGPGGAGRGAAVALVITETFASGGLLIFLGRRVLDHRLLTVLGKTLVICVIVSGVHYLLAPIGIWRLGVDIVLYAILVVASGAVNAQATVQTVRAMIAERRRPADVPSAGDGPLPGV